MPTRTLSDGKLDAISMLYNDAGTSRPKSTDPHELIVNVSSDFGHNTGELEELKIVLSSGTNKAIKANAGDVIRNRNKDEVSQNYRTVVRSIISKLPGFYMSNYFQRGGTLTAFVSMP